MLSDAHPVPDASSIDTKADLRKHMRQVRRDLDAAHVTALSQALAQRLLELPELQQAHVVMSYGATPEEIDPSECEARLRSRGARVAHPRVEADGLAVVEVTATSAFSTGFAGIQEPLGPAMDPQHVDVVLVPGLAFDRSGRRLGQGKAYYDRLLPAMRAVRIGVAFDEQVIEQVPTDAHDQTMDLLVTPSSLIHCH